MPMCGLFARLRRDDRGISAAEFALFLPIFMVLLVGLLETGWLFYQTNAVEKGLRAGALFAARSAAPLTSEAEEKAINLVKTGNTDGDLPYLVPGWDSATAEVQITTGSYDLNGAPVPVYKFAASVPFEPIVPGLLSMIGVDGYLITLTHEQAFVGD